MIRLPTCGSDLPHRLNAHNIAGPLRLTLVRVSGFNILGLTSPLPGQAPGPDPVWRAARRWAAALGAGLFRLASLQRILHSQAGRIGAEAELDKGAAFNFALGDGS